MLPLVTSSDGGGSIRIPASFTGAFGLKPSQGRIPRGPMKAWDYGSTAVYGDDLFHQSAVLKGSRSALVELRPLREFAEGSRQAAGYGITVTLTAPDRLSPAMSKARSISSSGTWWVSSPAQPSPAPARIRTASAKSSCPGRRA